MSNVFEIKCIEKNKQFDPDNRITRIGGVAKGEPWSLSQAEAIACIESGTHKFWVSIGGIYAWVVVATSSSGNKYIKTNSDREHPENLLSLPVC